MPEVNDPFEEAARQWEKKYGEPEPLRFPTPGALARFVQPNTIQTPALDLIDQALVDLKPDDRLIITMAPQEGKSRRIAHDFVLWKLIQDPDCRAACASYGQTLATRNGLSVRRSIQNNDLGLEVSKEVGSAGEWELAGRIGGLFSVGIGGPFGGKAVDLLVIDDPIRNRKEADSEVMRQAVWDWWTDVASARLGPGAPVVLILTRWHDDDLAGRLLKEEGSDWRVLNLKAQADHRPELGETDVMGREPGEFMVSARGRTREQWEQRKKTAGRRSWQALYQGDPSPAEGLVFSMGDLRFWTRYPSVAELSEIVGVGIGGTKFGGEVAYVPEAEFSKMRQTESWDLTFDDSSTSDFVVGQRWAARGSERYLLDQRRARMDFTKSVGAIQSFAAEGGLGRKGGKSPVRRRLIEKAANGAAALNTLRGKIGGLKPVKPLESKEARAIAVTPQFEAHDVRLPWPGDPGNEWVLDLIEELRLFPTGKHDDQVDALSQYLNFDAGWGNSGGGAVSLDAYRKQVEDRPRSGSRNAV